MRTVKRNYSYAHFDAWLRRAQEEFAKKNYRASAVAYRKVAALEIKHGDRREARKLRKKADAIARMSRPSRDLRHSATSARKQRQISRKIRLLREEGYPPKQAAAIAYRMYGEARSTHQVKKSAKRKLRHQGRQRQLRG